MSNTRPTVDMNETICSFTKNPREITKTLKRLSIAAETLGTVAGYFFSWPVDPDKYNIPEWIAPLKLIDVQDTKIVLCKVLDLDFFVNLYFMREEGINLLKKNGALTFVLVNHENDDRIKDQLINVINETIDSKAKQQQSLKDLHQALFRECRDPSLCLYSVRKEVPFEESMQSVDVISSCGEKTPKRLARILSE